MAIWDRLFGRHATKPRQATISSLPSSKAGGTANAIGKDDGHANDGDAASVGEFSLPAEPSTEASSRTGSGTRNDEVVNRVVSAMIARQTAEEEGTFETAGKNIKSIICSDNECPCTEQKPLVLGKDAYLYISPGVVNFRRDCRSVLELEMKVSQMKSPQDMLGAVENGMPKYVCETGAKRRGLDLSVALADGVAAAKTGFVPLRPTPKAQEKRETKSEGQRKDEGQGVEMLVADLLSSDRATRDQALVAARQMANKGVRAGADALEIAIRRKAGTDSIEFHAPGLRAIAGDEFLNARDNVLEIAKRGTICKEAKRVGSLMSQLLLQDSDSVQALFADIRKVGGEEQVHEFQLIGTHLQAVAGYQRSGANG